MKTTRTFTALSILFVTCLLVSNVLACKMISVWVLTLPAAVIIFPISYIVNDAISELYGFQKAKFTIYAGFIMNAIMVLAFTVASAIPAPVWWENQGAFEAILGNTGRVLLASFIAYLVGSLLNSKVMVAMRDRAQNGKGLFLRCITSTLVGETVDACIFISIAFFGTMDGKSLLTVIVSPAAFKVVYEIIIYPITRIVIGKLKEVENVE